MKDWDRIAKEYDAIIGETGDLYHKKYINPIMIKLIGKVKNKKVLDLACGNGYFSRLLQKKGAKVTGVDYSKELLKIAREKSKSINYIHNKAENIKDIKDDSQDLVVCNVALFDIRNASGAVKETARVLKKRGIFIFSLLHPFKNLGEKTKDYKLLVSKYNELVTIKKHDNRSYKILEEYNYYHRPLGWYTEQLSKNGFVITDLIEIISKHAKLKKLKGKEPEYKKQFPSFMIIKARKE